MIDFRNFISGESGIEVQSLDEALSLLEVCNENDIDCTFVDSDDYAEFPYWYVKDGELEAVKYYSDMAEEVCNTWIYSEFVEEHER